MITSKDILKATGIGSAKTLTRWHQRGIIPKPLVRTHPSGRGKIAYWPEWVLDRCVGVAELQRQGHSLQSAVKTLELERRAHNVERVLAEPSVSDVMETLQTQLLPGHQGTVLDAFLLVVLASVKQFIVKPADRQTLLAKLREEGAADLVTGLVRGGYNPVLLYNGSEVQIIPDFLVAHRLSEAASPHGPFVVAPLLPGLRQALPSLFSGLDEPAASAAPKVWVRDGDVVVEYMIYPNGIIGFELLRETAKVIGTSPRKVGTDAGS